MFHKLTNNIQNFFTPPEIPPTSLGYRTNNKYPEFPPLMADGRALISNWQPESHLNDKLIKKNNIQSNWEYRRYLQQNANQIMSENFKQSSNDTGFMFSPEHKPSIQSNSYSHLETFPYSYQSISDTSKPKGYVLSDLKQNYLTREELEARRVAPTMSKQM